MNNTLALKQTLRTSGVHAAERQLLIIADQGGDEELALVVADLEPAEVAVILKEGDFTKPSMAVEFITPTQFLGAIERFGSSWGDNFDDLDVLIEAKHHLGDFIFSVVLSTDDTKRRHELLDAMLENSVVRDVLNVLPLYEKGCEDLFSREFNTAMCQMGTWEELYALIHDFHPKVFQTMVGEIRSRFEQQQSGTNPKALTGFLKSVMKSLRQTAKNHVSKEEEKTPKARRVFRGL
jgi:hypothetical protein